MSTNASQRRWGIAMAVYLMGIFMGAIDTGIITPARTVIQTQLGIDNQTGIWMITIYTLAYAAAIPVMGKLADRNGRKNVYLVSIALFGIGSLLCGLSQDVGSFEMLIASRALQAIGGGGILPIATADIGTAVPREKRGMALGLVGAVYGVANVFGASAGSLVLDIAGAENWQWIFYINVPISLAIMVLGWRFLPNRRADEVAPIDVWGSLLLVSMILSLLWGVRNLDFFDFGASITSAEVWPWLVLVLLLLPVFVFVERRAADPVLNLGYFTDRGIALTLLLSLLSGVILMGVVFVPQFAENALKLPAGSGGYLVIVLGLASGIGAPLSGRLTDRFGPRVVLGFGALVSLVAAVVIIVWAIPQPSMTSVMVSLGLIGLGLGFIVGSPLNYMMLERTSDAESSSALGTLSLVRAIGTTLAPALMVGFLANAGTVVQERITDELPTTVTAAALPHAAELRSTLARWKADPTMAERMPDLDTSYLEGTTIDISAMSGEGELPNDLVELLQTPERVTEIQDGVQSGIDGLSTALVELDDAAGDMNDGLGEMDTTLADMDAGAAEMSDSLAQMDTGIAGMGRGLSGIEQAVSGMRQGITGLDRAIAGMDTGLTQQRSVIARLEAALAAMPSTPGGPPAPGSPAGPPSPGPGSPAAPPSPVPPTNTVAPEPTAAPTHSPTAGPTNSPAPTATPTPEPTGSPSPEPTATPSPGPSDAPAPEPTGGPTTAPWLTASGEPGAGPSATPSATPTPGPLPSATPEPSATPTPTPTPTPSAVPAPTSSDRPEPAPGPTGAPAPTASGPGGPAAGPPPGVGGPPPGVGGPPPGVGGPPPGVGGPPDPAALRGQLAALRAAQAKTQAQRDAASAQRTSLAQRLASVTAQGQDLAAQRAELADARRQLAEALAQLRDGQAELGAARDELTSGHTELIATRADVRTTLAQLRDVRDAVPSAFETARADYSAEIDARSDRIERVFQESLNTGFRDLYLLFIGACALSLLALAAVGRPRATPPTG